MKECENLIVDTQPEENPSTVTITNNGNIRLLHSLGYECRRYSNLCVSDERWLLFCSGSLLHMLDTHTGELVTRPSDRGCCFGHITKSPVQAHIAVGEKASNPCIIIYSWPSLEVIKTLKNGTENYFVFLSFSPDGRVLCSQGGSPDYTLTLWDWESASVIARGISPHTLRIYFSTFTHNCIITCGDEGITFWELTKTYTGIKLLSQKGRFNILDESQVLAVYSMPNGQIVSGCSWGNILVWAEGRVIMEACQRNNQACHDGPIVNFTYNKDIDELCTIGMDGWIKMWHYGRFKLDPFSDDINVIIKPVFEIHVQDARGPSVISYILKKNSNPDDSIWFGQDMNGGLWQIDMQVSASTAPPVRLYSCHSGSVISVATSPWSATLASLAENGVLHIYSLVTGKLLAIKEFQVGGSKLYWFSIQENVDEEIIAVGFIDGSVKLISLTEAGTSVTIKQETKPHKGRISAICINSEKAVLVTGSEDRTVFVYRLQTSLQLTPVGYLELEAPVRSFSWNPSQVGILLACCDSLISEILIPDDGFTGISYQLTAPITTLRVLKDGFAIEDLICAFYSKEKSIYLINKTGLYEYCWDSKSILNEMASDDHISAVYATSSTWYVGLENGKLRSFTKGPNGWLASGFEDIALHDRECGKITDITVSTKFNLLVDCGIDSNIFVFSIETKTDSSPEDDTERPTSHIVSGSGEVMEEEPGVSLEEAKKDAVLKEKMAVAMMKKAWVQKQLSSLRNKYCQILKRNAALPDSQRLRYSEFRLDKRLQFHIQDMIANEMKLVKQKLSFEVQKSQLRLHKMKHYFIDCLAAFHLEISAIRGKKSISTFVHRKLGEDFEKGEALIERMLKKSHEKIHDSGTELLQKPVPESSPSFMLEVETEEPFQRSLQDIYDKLSIKTKRALDKHKLIKLKKEERKKEWQAFLATQPAQDKNLSADISAIEQAMRTIGDYRLKSSEEFKLPDQSKNTSLHKLNQLVKAKREIFNMKEEFNRKVYALRDQKVELVKNVHVLVSQLLQLHEELPEECRIPPPSKPQLNMAKEFPERQYQIYPEMDLNLEDYQPVGDDEELFILHSHLTMRSMRDGENSKEDLENSEWETQIRTLRTSRQLFKQDKLLADIEELVIKFDQEVELLSRQKLQLSIDIKFLECFVNLLHQEFYIMHSFDDAEAAILERVNNSLAEKHTKHLRINILQHKMDARAAEVAVLEEKLAAVEKIFTELSAGSRVSKHLNRVFRKKSRPHFFGSEEEEEEEESEESSSDGTSEDSDTAVSVGRPSPRRKEGKCPAECDAEVHKETLQLREKKYKLEAKINAEKTVIDKMRREKERNFKFLKLIEPVLRMNQDQLEKIQKDKQFKLNETEVLVVLRCSQICGQSLLMSRPELDKLRARVSELQRQTDHQLDKLRKSQRHQQRLTEECLQMEAKISKLKKDIDKAMICKFGQHVDVETLEEKSLEQMIKNTRKSIREEELHKKYEKIINDLKEELLEKTEYLADLTRENTHKLQMLSSLDDEKQKLLALAKRVKKAATDSTDREKEYIQDVRSLIRILQNLKLQKETIIHEIKVLTLKGRPLPPIPPPSIVEEQTKSTTAQTQSYRDSDDLASTECQTTREGSPGILRAATPGFPRVIRSQDDLEDEETGDDAENEGDGMEDQGDSREDEGDDMENQDDDADHRKEIDSVEDETSYANDQDIDAKNQDDAENQQDDLECQMDDEKNQRVYEEHQGIIAKDQRDNSDNHMDDLKNKGDDAGNQQDQGNDKENQYDIDNLVNQRDVLENQGGNGEDKADDVDNEDNMEERVDVENQGDDSENQKHDVEIQETNVEDEGDNAEDAEDDVEKHGNQVDFVVKDGGEKDQGNIKGQDDDSVSQRDGLETQGGNGEDQSEDVDNEDDMEERGDVENQVDDSENKKHDM